MHFSYPSPCIIWTLNWFHWKRQSTIDLHRMRHNDNQPISYHKQTNKHSSIYPYINRPLHFVHIRNGHIGKWRCIFQLNLWCHRIKSAIWYIWVLVLVTSVRGLSFDYDTNHQPHSYLFAIKVHRCLFDEWCGRWLNCHSPCLMTIDVLQRNEKKTVIIYCILIGRTAMAKTGTVFFP